MSKQQETDQENPGTPPAGGCCAGMMEKIMGQRGKGDCCEIMAKMMASCCCKGTTEGEKPDSEQDPPVASGVAKSAACGCG